MYTQVHRHHSTGALPWKNFDYQQYFYQTVQEVCFFVSWLISGIHASRVCSNVAVCHETEEGLLTDCHLFQLFLIPVCKILYGGGGSIVDYTV